MVLCISFFACMQCVDRGKSMSSLMAFLLFYFFRAPTAAVQASGHDDVATITSQVSDPAGGHRNLVVFLWSCWVTCTSVASCVRNQTRSSAAVT